MEYARANRSTDGIVGSVKSEVLPNRNLLFVDDSAETCEMMEFLLSRLGYTPYCVTTTAAAIEAVGNVPIGFALVDGDLGDSDYSAHGLAGQFIQGHLTGSIRYGRYSASPQSIPGDLRGEVFFDKTAIDDSPFRDWLKAVLPKV